MWVRPGTIVQKKSNVRVLLMRPSSTADACGVFRTRGQAKTTHHQSASSNHTCSMNQAAGRGHHNRHHPTSKRVAMPKESERERERETARNKAWEVGPRHTVRSAFTCLHHQNRQHHRSGTCRHDGSLRLAGQPSAHAPAPSQQQGRTAPASWTHAPSRHGSTAR